MMMTLAAWESARQNKEAVKAEVIEALFWLPESYAFRSKHTFKTPMFTAVRMCSNARIESVSLWSRFQALERSFSCEREAETYESILV